MCKLGYFEDPQVSSQTLSLDVGQVIFQHDTPAEHVYILQRGEVRLYSVGPEGATRLVNIIGPGEWFGASALARLPAYGMRAVAVTASVVIQARADRFLDVLSRNPEAMVDLSRELAAKLMNVTHQASSLVFDDCNQRLINTLVRFSQSAASSRRDDGVVLRITHDQLAQAVGVARETVSLALTQLRQRNLLRTGRNQLVFNPDALIRFNNENGTNGKAHAEALTV